MTFAFPPPLPPSVAIDGSAERFPVRRIFCVGRNYAEHAREMGGKPESEPPFFFMKPADAAIDSGSAIAYPPLTKDLHHEVELVAAIGQGGFDVSPEAALDLVYGYAVGIDLTRRDLQKILREAGRPWDWAKGFDQSAPCGPLKRISETGHLSRGAITLTVNGMVRQRGDLADMVWSVGDVISAISRSMSLQPGDLVFTGTPSGVGPIQIGDELKGDVAGLPPLTITIGALASGS